MKWYKARVNQKCSNCKEDIPKGEEYYGNSTSSFCTPNGCGNLRETGQLTFDTKSKSYIVVKNKLFCDLCDNVAAGEVNGKALCKEHGG